MTTSVGPQGAARFDYHGKYRLAVGAGSTVFLHLHPPGNPAGNIDLSGYTQGFVGAARRERNEALTTTPLFVVSAHFTTNAEVPGSSGDGTDGNLTLVVLGTELGQDTPARGYYDLHGINGTGVPALLVTGRYECIGGTVDPAAPVPA